MLGLPSTGKRLHKVEGRVMMGIMGALLYNQGAVLNEMNQYGVGEG